MFEKEPPHATEQGIHEARAQQQRIPGENVVCVSAGLSLEVLKENATRWNVSSVQGHKGRFVMVAATLSNQPLRGITQHCPSMANRREKDLYNVWSVMQELCQDNQACPSHRLRIVQNNGKHSLLFHR